ncbi:MAG: CRISPR-associated protein Cas5, partial [Thermoflexales bacterium]|nr:CRISPR-associated protein Cas5 [Thermoflexales bacterium]
MEVLRVILEGEVTSFRYPFTMVGRQLSFLMPPPATIYGHVCSALGEWVDPRSFRFAYTFSSAATFDDLEHIHVVSASSGKLPGTDLPKALEGNINPFRRQLLFRPRLVLYLTRPDWREAFLHPAYPVVLGRSQDLCTYTEVRVVRLEQRERGYFEHTLLPFEYPLKLPQGIVLNMPKWLDVHRNRAPQFARYTLVNRRV